MSPTSKTFSLSAHAETFASTYAHARRTGADRPLAQRFGLADVLGEVETITADRVAVAVGKARDELAREHRAELARVRAEHASELLRAAAEGDRDRRAAETGSRFTVGQSLSLDELKALPVGAKIRAAGSLSEFYRRPAGPRMASGEVGLFSRRPAADVGQLWAETVSSYGRATLLSLPGAPATPAPAAPRVGDVLTEAQLDALPVGAQVRDRDGDYSRKTSPRGLTAWYRGGPSPVSRYVSGYLPSRLVAAYAPVTLARLP